MVPWSNGARTYFIDNNPESVDPLTTFVCKFFRFLVFTFGNCPLIELVLTLVICFSNGTSYGYEPQNSFIGTVA